MNINQNGMKNNMILRAMPAKFKQEEVNTKTNATPGIITKTRTLDKESKGSSTNSAVSKKQLPVRKNTYSPSKQKTQDNLNEKNKIVLKTENTSSSAKTSTVSSNLNSSNIYTHQRKSESSKLEMLLKKDDKKDDKKEDKDRRASNISSVNLQPKEKISAVNSGKLTSSAVNPSTNLRSSNPEQSKLTLTTTNKNTLAKSANLAKTSTAQPKAQPAQSKVQTTQPKGSKHLLNLDEVRLFLLFL